MTPFWLRRRRRLTPLNIALAAAFTELAKQIVRLGLRFVLKLLK